MKTYRLIPTETAQNLPEALYELIAMHNQLIIQPHYDGPPMPWDADFQIEGGLFILNGHAGASGWGTARVTIPLKDAAAAYAITCDAIEKEFTPEIIDQFNQLGWMVEDRPAE
jgi:hypothetical protein